MQLYRGSVGRAYHQLYQPIMPYKDELETLLSIPSNVNKKTSKAKTLEAENRELKEQNEALKKEITAIRESQNNVLTATN
jgi:dCMP deaminase